LSGFDRPDTFDLPLGLPFFRSTYRSALPLLSPSPGDIRNVMIRRLFLGLLLALVACPADAARGPAGPVRVRIETSLGPIVIQLETRRAPITSANFLRYVDDKRFDGTTFYRASRTDGAPTTGLVQGGIDHDMPRSFLPIKHEPTTVTGLHHIDGAVSMARNDPGTAMGDFFIVIGDGRSYLDARGEYAGYAVFGHVVSGMDVAKRILAMPTFPGGWSQETIGQSIKAPPKILSVRRLP
jgi:peptidyl-prolyl cis-trans isomerase A (cyclophilin A)